jgi:hypothetical protein
MAYIESRRCNAILYPNRKKRMQWQCDFCGVMTMEDGNKFWVYAYEKKTEKGDDCLGIKIVPYAGEGRT